MVKPVTGRVALDDQPIRTALKQNLVAYVPQSEDVDWNFPVLVRDVVMMGRYGKMSFLRIPSANDKCKVEEALARVGLVPVRAAGARRRLATPFAIVRGDVRAAVAAPVVRRQGFRLKIAICARRINADSS